MNGTTQPQKKQSVFLEKGSWKKTPLFIKILLILFYGILAISFISVVGLGKSVVSIAVISGVVYWIRSMYKESQKNEHVHEESKDTHSEQQEKGMSGFCPHCNQANVHGLYCHSCGKKLEIKKETHTDTVSKENTLNKEIKISFSSIGTLLLIGGLVVGVYFLMFFDTSVAVPQQEIFGEVIGGGRVNNIGLMNDRQNGINLGFGAFVVGLVLRYVEENKKKNNEK
jgi:hypothetical protein